jgi:electron transfer flavoprotein beta subunit
MNLVACVKQVPETTEVRIDPKTNALIREKGVINPFDENAVEAALQLKEAYGGTVTVLCMGPPQAEEMLRGCLAMGADAAYLICDLAVRGSDTLATSYTLARAVRKLGDVDLVICGKQAIDGDTGQVGPGLAERLGYPQVTFAISLEVADGKLRARRVLDDFYEVIEVKLPAVVTVVKQINEPRHPSMKNVLKAKRATITTWTAADLEADLTQTGFEGSPTQVIQVWPPPKRAGGQVLEGEPDELARKLAEIIKGMQIATS